MDTSHNLTGASLATRNLLPFGALFTARVAVACGCEAVDVELARPRPGGAAAAARLDPDVVTPAIVWISGESAVDAERRPVGALLGRRPPTTRPLVVVDTPNRVDESLAAVVAAYGLAEQLDRLGQACEVAVGLRGTALVGGRRHLATLSLVRRQAEEWGVGVALDLAGSFDPFWEAEAAVLRLGERLILVRANAAATLPTATGWQRVVRRAIRTAFEQSPRIRLSLEPNVRWWQRRSVRALAESWTQAAIRAQSWRGPLVTDAFRLRDEEHRRRFSPPR